MRRLGPVLAYLPWHARDAVGRALAPVLIAAGVIGIPVYGFLFSSGEADLAEARGVDLAMTIYQSGITLAIVLGAIILMNQVIALDREKQHFRFLLSNPVTPWVFYLQRFAVGLAMFVVCVAIIPLTFSALVVDVSLMAAVKSAVVQGLLVGSLAMLCSVLTSKDGVALIVTYVLASILHDLRKVDVLSSWLETLARALPPIGTMSEIHNQMMNGLAVDRSDVLFVLAYAFGMLALALYLVKRLPLAR